MEYIFQIKELSKEYNGKKVLDIKELNIEQGKITAIIGPSGAGKSTLLHILNCIEPPTEGKLIFDGDVLNWQKRLDINLRRQMAMVFQKPVVFNTSVYENVAYGLKLRKLPERIIKERVNEILELVGLKELAQQKARTLSGGEAQRVAMARAIVMRPKVLLLDEPTANLDPANIIMIEELIQLAKTAYNATVIIVTHNMFQAKRFADYVIFLLNGSVVEVGTAAKIFNQPEDERTQAFICGDMVF